MSADNEINHSYIPEVTDEISEKAVFVSAKKSK